MSKGGTRADGFFCIGRSRKDRHVFGFDICPPAEHRAKDHRHGAFHDLDAFVLLIVDLVPGFRRVSPRSTVGGPRQSRDLDHYVTHAASVAHRWGAPGGCVVGKRNPPGCSVPVERWAGATQGLMRSADDAYLVHRFLRFADLYAWQPLRR